jgi:hypothetical protein
MFGITGVVDILKSLIALFPNAEQRGAAAAKLQDLELAIANNQSQTDTAEAQTGSFLLAGWRPFVGWICALGFAYSVVVPVVHGQPLDTNTLNNLLWGMLGLGAYRSSEKLGGVATTVIKGILRK